MTKFQHHKLPDHSALLSGHAPPDEFSFLSDHLQIWYNNTAMSWIKESEVPHMHLHSDECFLVLQGTLVVEADGERFSIGPREICFFPAGLYHSITEIHPPIESLMIRAPSINDKVYQSGEENINSNHTTD